MIVLKIMTRGDAFEAQGEWKGSGSCLRGTSITDGLCKVVSALAYPVPPRERGMGMLGTTFVKKRNVEIEKT